MWMVREIGDWFSGGRERYQSLFEAMRGDMPWLLALALLAIALLVGYARIGWQWRRQERRMVDGVRRQALARLRRTLLMGAAAGYVMLPVAMLWPGWRLYVLVLAGVTLIVWRLALRRQDVHVLCHSLDRSRTDRGELNHARAEARRKAFFLNALGHDLKNPLHGLTLQTQVAEVCLERGDVEGVQRSLRLMRDCTHEASTLLENFLELGRLDWCGETESPTRSPFDLAALLGHLADEHEPLAAQQGLTLERELPEQLWVHGDQWRIDRIARNLLSNAIKYTNEGKVLIRGWAEGRSVIVEIEDTGPGIAPEVQEHLFDVFYRAHHGGADGPSGHGLGLAIAARLSQQLGSRVELDSEPGRGSRFRFALPEARLAESEPATPLSICAGLERPT